MDPSDRSLRLVKKDIFTNIYERNCAEGSVFSLSGTIFNIGRKGPFDDQKRCARECSFELQSRTRGNKKWKFCLLASLLSFFLKFRYKVRIFWLKMTTFNKKFAKKWRKSGVLLFEEINKFWQMSMSVSFAEQNEGTVSSIRHAQLTLRSNGTPHFQVQFLREECSIFK